MENKKKHNQNFYILEKSAKCSVLILKIPSTPQIYFSMISCQILLFHDLKQFFVILSFKILLIYVVPWFPSRIFKNLSYNFEKNISRRKQFRINPSNLVRFDLNTWLSHYVCFRNTLLLTWRRDRVGTTRVASRRSRAYSKTYFNF
jgi:hypothetical protein